MYHIQLWKEFIRLTFHFLDAIASQQPMQSSHHHTPQKSLGTPIKIFSNSLETPKTSSKTPETSWETPETFLEIPKNPWRPNGNSSERNH